MSFREQLRDEILPKAVGYFNSGLGMNESVVKAAEDFGLNLDQTDRLVETMNTARTIAHYEKNAEDRTAPFDIADKDEVRRLIFGGDSTKAASAPASSHDGDGHQYGAYDSYLDPEPDYRAGRRNRGSDLLEKAASANSADDSVKALTGRQLVDLLSKKAHALFKLAEDIDSSIGMMNDHAETALQKIASDLRRGFDPENRVALFKAACSKRFPAVWTSVERRLPGDLLKSASGVYRRLLSENVVDTSDVDGLVSMADDISEVFGKVAEARERAESARKAEAGARAVLGKIAQAGGVDSGAGGGRGGGHGEGGSAGGGGSNGNRPLTLNKMLDDIQNSAFEALRPEKPKYEGIQSYLDNIQRSAIITDLIENDPIISEAQPSDVAKAYSTLVQSAPGVSLNKEVVRAILRQSVNSVAVSPFDMKQWSDADNVLLKNKQLA